MKDFLATVGGLILVLFLIGVGFEFLYTVGINPFM